MLSTVVPVALVQDNVLRRRCQNVKSVQCNTNYFWEGGIDFSTQSLEKTHWGQVVMVLSDFVDMTAT